MQRLLDAVELQEAQVAAGLYGVQDLTGVTAAAKAGLLRSSMSRTVVSMQRLPDALELQEAQVATGLYGVQGLTCVTAASKAGLVSSERQQHCSQHAETA